MIQFFNLVIRLGGLNECKEYKENQTELQILQSQNDFQESQISEPAHYLNNYSCLRTPWTASLAQ